MPTQFDLMNLFLDFQREAEQNGLYLLNDFKYVIFDKNAPDYEIFYTSDSDEEESP